MNNQQIIDENEKLKFKVNKQQEDINYLRDENEELRKLLTLAKTKRGSVEAEKER